MRTKANKAQATPDGAVSSADADGAFWPGAPILVVRRLYSPVHWRLFIRNTKKIIIAWVLNLVVGAAAQVVPVYQNSFDSGVVSLAGWTSFGSGSISVSSGQLTIGLTDFADAGVSLNMEAFLPTSPPSPNSDYRDNQSGVLGAI